MTLTEQLREQLNGLRIGSGVIVDVDATGAHIRSSLDSVVRGKDFKYSVKFQSAERLYKVTKIPRTEKVNFTKYILGKVSGLDRGEKINVEPLGRDSKVLRATVTHVGKLIGSRFGVTDCNETGLIFILKKD